MVNELQCDVCNKKYKTEQTLKTHKNKFHKNVANSEEISSPKKENDQEDSDSELDFDSESRELILKKLEKLMEIQDFIKSCDENIVDIFIATPENNNRIKWICGYEKLKRDDEFENIEDKVKYYKDLVERNRVIIL